MVSPDSKHLLFTIKTKKPLLIIYDLVKRQLILGSIFEKHYLAKIYAS
jgi:hypothetical protein